MGDVVLHTLHRLRTEGMVVVDADLHVDLEAPSPGGRKLPVGATLTIRLTPGRDR